MRRRTFRIIVAAFIVMLLAVPCHAWWVTRPSGSGQVMTCSITAPAASSAAAVSGAGFFYGIVVKTDGTNAVTVNIFDNTAGSGTRLIPTDLVIQGEAYYFGYSTPLPIHCSNGIYVSISVSGGGSCAYQVFYDK